ncbi:MAG: 16S rRNA (guanine(527)-N(7))-methyltransferase RsmG [Sphaerochaetaceae bacterium]
MNKPLLLSCLEQMELSFSDEQMLQLENYYKTLEYFNPLLRMVKADGDDFIVRHFADSLVAVKTLQDIAKGYEKPVIADLGSGAGLPGIPLAIALPSCRFVLVERMEKRVDFLLTVLAACKIGNATVLNRRLCEVAEKFEIVTCRAFHPFYDVESEVDSVLADGGTVMLYKGRMEVLQYELGQLKGDWKFDLQSVKVPYLDAQRTLCIGRKK